MTLDTKFGRYHVAETPSSLRSVHLYDGAPLKVVDHEPALAVLDQEDLLKQGIETSTFISGCTTNVDALGSCTANAFTAGLSNVVAGPTAFNAATALLSGSQAPQSFADTKAAEEFAIRFYNVCTLQTGETSSEWPPNDCGSSGPYVVSEATRLRLIGGAKIAHGAQSIVSLLQTNGLIVGQPFLNAWMNPNAQGFIDGDGSLSSLETQISQGVAGGHETYLCAIETLVLNETGTVDPFKTVIRFRNSWTSSWGDNGDYRAHLSTYVALGSYCDFRLLLPPT